MNQRIILHYLWVQMSAFVWTQFLHHRMFMHLTPDILKCSLGLQCVNKLWRFPSISCYWDLNLKNIFFVCCHVFTTTICLLSILSHIYGSFNKTHAIALKPHIPRFFKVTFLSSAKISNQEHPVVNVLIKSQLCVTPLFTTTECLWRACMGTQETNEHYITDAISAC